MLIEIKFKCKVCQKSSYAKDGNIKMVNGWPVCSDECAFAAADLPPPEPHPTRHQFRGQQDD
jgi:hypothetical protein